VTASAAAASIAGRLLTASATAFSGRDVAGLDRLDELMARVNARRAAAATQPTVRAAGRVRGLDPGDEVAARRAERQP